MKKETNAKENMKKKRKKSKIKKFFKFLFTLILIAILAYGGYFGYNYYRHMKNIEVGQQEYDPLSAAALGIDPEKLKEVGRINILILGISGVEEDYKLADSIMVASYNPQTQQVSLLSIPRDTYVGKKDKNTATSNYLASYKINSVYRNGTNMKEMIECVNNLTGLEIDKYIVIDTQAIIKVVDAIGGVTFDVPIDMDYDDPTQDLHIHLEAGEQLIDGPKAEQLLRFRHNNDGSSYPIEYGDNDYGRMRTQREFIQVTANQLFKLENATKVLNLLDIAFNNIETNLDIQTAKYYIPYIFKFNTNNIQSDMVPGQSEQCNEIWIYTPNKVQTKQVVEDLFTDRIMEEEIEDEVLQEENTNNEIENEQVSNTQLKNVTIELLDGIGDSKILNQIKNDLKQQGYSVTKSGTTTTTSKTLIINRTKQPTSIEKELKQILGIGNNIKGSDNSNVDITIIIGNDY